MNVHMPIHENPALNGANAPVDREIVATELPVIGELPKDLNGVYVRNGPNARFAPDWRYHAYDGDGMLHALRFENGKASYRNRWVRTAAMIEEQAAGHPLWKGLKEPPRRDRPDQPYKNTANTDVKFHNGKLIAMWYQSGLPYHVDIDTLETIGPADYDGAITRISAHSRPDEHTGELLYFDYFKEAPYMKCGVIGADGKRKTEIPIRLPGARLPHDMAVTDKYTILHDFPLFQDAEAARHGRYKVKFHREMPSRFAVVPRHGAEHEIKWFEAKPGYMLHVVNAWDDGDEVVMVGTPYRVHAGADGGLDAERLQQTIRLRQRDFQLYEWRFNLKTGGTSERVIDDVLNTEFPVINSAYQGRKNRYSYNVLFPQGGREEPRFPVGSPPVSTRSSSRGNHPMARDNEAHRIGRAGTGDRSRRLGLADGRGHIGISAGLAIGNALQGSPHLPLKGRCLHVDGQVERRRRSAQVLQDGLHPVRPRLLIGADLGRRILASQVADQRRF